MGYYTLICLDHLGLQTELLPNAQNAALKCASPQFSWTLSKQSSLAKAGPIAIGNALVVLH